MAYFANGQVGRSYIAEHCSSCANGPGVSCPIQRLHVLWGDDGARGNEDKQFALDLFIPMEDDGITPGECKMFLPVEKQGRQ